MADRHLHAIDHGQAIDAETGEVKGKACRTCPDKDILIDQLQVEMRGKSMQIGKLKAELASVRAVEPEAQDIIDVLEHCRKVWGKRWAIVPGSKRWGKVRERFKDRPLDADPFTKDQLIKAAEGALLDEWLSGKHHKSKGYLNVETVFRDFEQVERLIDLADGFEVKTGMALQDFPAELREADLGFLARRCDCGHLRIEHYVPDREHGYQACRRCDDCIDFYDGEAQLRELEERHRGGGDG